MIYKVENKKSSKRILSDFIIKEIGKEREDETYETLTSNITNANELRDRLGLEQTQEGILALRCDKQTKKRGKKSLAEIRLKTGKKEDQSKISEILKVGKGKNLPTEQ